MCIRPVLLWGTDPGSRGGAQHPRFTGDQSQAVSQLVAKLRRRSPASGSHPGSACLDQDVWNKSTKRRRRGSRACLDGEGQPRAVAELRPAGAPVAQGLLPVAMLGSVLLTGEGTGWERSIYTEAYADRTQFGCIEHILTITAPDIDDTPDLAGTVLDDALPALCRVLTALGRCSQSNVCSTGLERRLHS